MSEKPRGWFQFHLSTAIVLLLVVGALMFLNMRSIWHGERENGLVRWLPHEARNDPRWWEYGWPLKAYRYVPFGTLTGDGFRLEFSWSSALVDAAVFFRDCAGRSRCGQVHALPDSA